MGRGPYRNPPKLSHSQVLEIKASKLPPGILAYKYRVSVRYIRMLRKGERRKDG
jgi:hypothetical protein